MIANNVTDKNELIRAFVAVSVGEAAARELERLLTRLAPMARIRWVTRMQLHITLKFLGECTSAEIKRVKSALARLKQEGFTPFDITLGKSGAFPNMNRPNTIWLGATQGAEELTALAGRVENALATVGFPREKRPFQPHLTLARAKGQALPESLVKALATVPSFSWQCADFQLMHSRLTPRGAIYTQIAL